MVLEKCIGEKTSKMKAKRVRHIANVKSVYGKMSHIQTYSNKYMRHTKVSVISFAKYFRFRPSPECSPCSM